MAGPLTGLKVIELAGIGPGPFCGMMLADMGAEVVAVERPGGGFAPHYNDPLRRSRREVALDLKRAAHVAALLALIEKADALIEGFRPGVAERLGVGPDAALTRNPRLVYCRLTGWGQEGPLAKAAGHDLTYIATAGALSAIGRAGERPVPPLNLVGDYGGGGMLAAFGVVCAVWEAQRSGKGQVVDAAMLDGVLTLMAAFIGFQGLGFFDGRTGGHFLGGAAHYYDTYETKDAKHVAVAAIEPKFYAELIERLGLDWAEFAPHGFDAGDGEAARAAWPRLKAKLAAVFRSRTREEWCALLEGTDACVAPVLTLEEAARHPHNVARGAFVEVGGLLQNRPAPRFSRTAPDAPRPAAPTGAETLAVLADWGVSQDLIAAVEAG